MESCTSDKYSPKEPYPSSRFQQRLCCIIVSGGGRNIWLDQPCSRSHIHEGSRVYFRSAHYFLVLLKPSLLFTQPILQDRRHEVRPLHTSLQPLIHLLHPIIKMICFLLHDAFRNQLPRYGFQSRILIQHAD